MIPPAHHKEVARYLREMIPGEPKIVVYRDENDQHPIPIGKFGVSTHRFFSTIGAFDEPKAIPDGAFEFAACGSLEWLPNAIASSIYWLKGRECTEWPLVCEDVVRDNARSSYRHMAYAPSPFKLVLTTGRQVQWLLGVPIRDKEIGLSLDNAEEKARGIYPPWLYKKDA